MLEWEQTLDFLGWCVMSGAITTDDVRKWADMMLLDGDDHVELLAELSMYNGHPAKIFHNKIIDELMTNQWFKCESETDALYGIACKRGFDPCEMSCEKASMHLEKHPHVEQIFREVFPFIEF